MLAADIIKELCKMCIHIIFITQKSDRSEYTIYLRYVDIPMWLYALI